MNPLPNRVPKWGPQKGLSGLPRPGAQGSILVVEGLLGPAQGSILVWKGLLVYCPVDVSTEQYTNKTYADMGSRYILNTKAIRVIYRTSYDLPLILPVPVDSHMAAVLSGLGKR